MRAHHAKHLLALLVIAIIALTITGCGGCGDDEKAAGNISTIITYEDGSENIEDSYFRGYSEGKDDGLDNIIRGTSETGVVAYPDGSKSSDIAFDDGYNDGYALGSAQEFYGQSDDEYYDDQSGWSEEDEYYYDEPVTLKQEAAAARKVKRSIKQLCTTHEVNQPRRMNLLRDALDEHDLSAGEVLGSDELKYRRQQIKDWSDQCKLSRQTYKSYAYDYEFEMTDDLP